MHGYLAFNKVRTGNGSTGTSTFAMLVLENELSKVYFELDMVTIPRGDLVAITKNKNKAIPSVKFYSDNLENLLLLDKVLIEQQYFWEEGGFHE